MECEFPTVNSNKDEIKEIFDNTKTIAIVGLSPDSEKASFRVASYLQSKGFKIVPIYPKEDEILGEKVYRSLEEIPFDIDMVDIFRKPDAIAKVVDEAIRLKDSKNIKSVWFQLGLANNEAAQKAVENGLKVVQNKCTKIEHKAIYE
ncbi:CoA-binding protein [Aliarcobacter skirrowii]|jgi:predicted CoA-binding protein|uniref:CoA-binding domain-containing protein n=2 Tax=Aliarcobacter skirrowii TaxID=28200 RepID=A0AAD0WN71_9BACT|nr:CoA-binding protein [Aliarcobacter skirrowii]AXX84190.1 CoA-binding domain-containing protein [Aliarcobacter skirrowii CCUG 10374]AZL53345.1 CoA-binding protein [Aliarcobacter skirrowii]KAB0621626.1 CoA-binding protein [Aliarcobacter skirrowii CCUG 10374]MDX4027191.1 CoA-binding protein [Aliarcobacter skirrowii]MDX4037500.1 CoA-binding protein [Aliarcobacter skirrowii]